MSTRVYVYKVSVIMRALLYLKVNIDRLVAEVWFHLKSDDVTLRSSSCLIVCILLQGLQAGWLRDYSYRCQPVDYSNNPLALRVRLRTMYKLQNFVVRPCSHTLLFSHCHIQYRLFPLSE